MNEPIQLDMTEQNELTFKVKVDGAPGAHANIRMVCEAGEVSYMFRARPSYEIDTFDFTIPSMKGKLSEGSYKSRLEVLIEGKYFTPAEFDLVFKEPVKVVAEAISKPTAPLVQETKVAISAEQVVKSKPSSVREAVVSEQPARTPGVGKTLKQHYAETKKNK